MLFMVHDGCVTWIYGKFQGSAARSVEVFALCPHLVSLSMFHAGR